MPEARMRSSAIRLASWSRRVVLLTTTVRRRSRREFVMPRWSHPLIVAVLVGGLLGAGRLPGAARSLFVAPATSPTPISLVGAWQLLVTSPDAPPFSVLTIFSADGTMSAADGPVEAIGQDQVAVLSVGQGVWTAGSPAAFTVRELLATGDGAAVGMNVIRGEATLGADGQTIRGPFQYELVAVNGQVLGSGGGTLTGTRLTVRPLGTPTG